MMLRGAVVGAAAAVAVRTSVPVVAPAAMVSGAAVTPVGKLSTVNVIGPVKPFVRVIVTGMLVVAPCTIVPVEEPVASVIAGLGTVRATVVVWLVTPEPLALMVTVLVPPAAVESTVRVRVEVVALPASDAGENEALTPLGSPVALSDTAPV